jgi:hypothetical protein
MFTEILILLWATILAAVQSCSAACIFDDLTCLTLIYCPWIFFGIFFKVSQSVRLYHKLNSRKYKKNSSKYIKNTQQLIW